MTFNYFEFFFTYNLYTHTFSKDTLKNTMAYRSAINPQWQIVPEDLLDESTVGYDMVKFQPRNPIIAGGVARNNPTMTIQVDNSDAFLKMSEAVLQVKFKVVHDGAFAGGESDPPDPPAHTDGSDTRPDEITTVNSNVLSLFRHATLKIGQVTVEDSDYPGYSSLVKNLMYMDKDYADDTSETEWFYPESANVTYGDSNAEATNPTAKHLGGGNASLRKYDYGADTMNISHAYNESYRRRFYRSQASQEVEVMVPLARIFGWCQDYRSVMRGLTHEIVLQKNTNYAEVIQSADGVAPMRTFITDLNLYVPHLKPSNQTLALIEEQLLSGAANKVFYEQWSAYRSQNYTYTTTTAEYRALQLTEKPLYAFVGLQFDEQYNSQNDNSLAIDTPDRIRTAMRFKTYDLATDGTEGRGFRDISKVNIIVGGQRFPLEDYQTDFSADQYARVYSDFLRVTSKAPFNPDESSLVSFKDFKQLYGLFAFDLRPLAHMWKNGNSLDLRVQVQTEAGTVAGSEWSVLLVLATEKSKIVGATDGRLFVSESQ